MPPWVWYSAASVTLIITFCFYMIRGVMSFKEFTGCIPEGFKAMVAPILILTMAWTLSGMTGLSGRCKYYVARSGMPLPQARSSCSCRQSSSSLLCSWRSATGTSWGTFAILIPVVCHVFRQRRYLSDARHLDRGLPLRRGLRRPLFPDLGHHHHGIRRCAIPTTSTMYPPSCPMR